MECVQPCAWRQLRRLNGTAIFSKRMSHPSGSSLSLTELPQTITMKAQTFSYANINWKILLLHSSWSKLCQKYKRGQSLFWKLDYNWLISRRLENLLQKSIPSPPMFKRHRKHPIKQYILQNYFSSKQAIHSSKSSNTFFKIKLPQTTTACNCGCSLKRLDCTLLDKDTLFSEMKKGKSHRLYSALCLTLLQFDRFARSVFYPAWA